MCKNTQIVENLQKCPKLHKKGKNLLKKCMKKQKISTRGKVAVAIFFHLCPPHPKLPARAIVDTDQSRAETEGEGKGGFNYLI